MTRDDYIEMMDCAKNLNKMAECLLYMTERMMRAIKNTGINDGADAQLPFLKETQEPDA